MFETLLEFIAISKVSFNLFDFFVAISLLDFFCIYFRSTFILRMSLNSGAYRLEEGVDSALTILNCFFVLLIGDITDFLWAGDPLFEQISTYLAFTADFDALDISGPDLIFLAFFEKSWLDDDF